MGLKNPTFVGLRRLETLDRGLDQFELDAGRFESWLKNVQGQTQSLRQLVGKESHSIDEVKQITKLFMVR